MALTKPCEFKYTLDGSAPVSKKWPTASGVEVRKGQLVMLSAGSIEEAEPGSVMPVIGVAEEDQLTAGQLCSVNMNLQSVYEAQIDATSSNTYAGVRCDVDSGTQLDPSDTTVPHVMLLKYVGATTDQRHEFVILGYDTD